MKFNKSAKIITSLALAVIMIASLIVPAMAYQSAFKSGAAVTSFSQTAKDKMAAMKDGDNIFALGEYDTAAYATPAVYCESGLAQFVYQHADNKWGRAIKDTGWTINGMANIGNGIIDTATTGDKPANCLYFGKKTDSAKKVNANAVETGKADSKYYTLAGWEFAADFRVKGFKIYFGQNAYADDFDILVGHLDGDDIVWEVAFSGNDMKDKFTAVEEFTNDIYSYDAEFCKTMEGRFIQIATKSYDGHSTENKDGYYCYVCPEFEVYSGEVDGANHNVVEVPASATCTEDGLAAHYECDKCGTMFADAAGTTAITEADIEVAAALGHNFVDGECTRCGLGGGVITDEASFLAMDPAGVYSLANDITISESYASTFTGSFDGKGHTIINSAPVFAAIGGNAEIRNIVLDGSKVIGETDTTPVASLASTVANAAANILIDNVINHTDVENVYRTGSIIGQVNCSEKTEVHVTITNCANYGEINGTNMVGGIIGYSQRRTLTVDNCKNYGNVTCSDGQAGGIVGRFGMDKAIAADVLATVTNCANYGTVSAKSYAGGIVANIVGATIVIKDSYNFGAVTGGTTTAGILGTTTSDKNYKANVTLTRCLNAADITSTGKQAGGLCGYAYGSGATNNIKCYYCVNTGNIMGTTQVSQLVAYCNSSSTTIDNCVAAGSIGAYNDAAAFLCFIGSSTQKATDYNFSNVYYISSDKPAYFGYSATAGNESTWEDRVGLNLVDAEALASGEIAIALNAAIGEDVFGQNLDKVGVEKSPVPLPTADQAKVYDLGDGKYSNHENGAPTFAAQVAVGENISIILTVNTDAAVTVKDADGNDIALTVESADGPYVYRIYDITPQMMSDVFTISVEGADSVEFSIRDYCMSVLEKCEDEDICNFVENLLHYGAAAQVWADYNTENLADASLSAAAAPDLLTSTDKKWVANREYDGNVKVTAAGMYFDFQNSLYFKTSGEGVVTYKVNGGDAVNAATVDGAIGGIFAELSITELAQVYEVAVYDNGTLVGTLTYSGLSFIYSNQSKSGARGDFAKSMLNLYYSAMALIAE